MLGFFLLLELESSGIDAVTGFGRLRAVIKEVAEMSSAMTAGHFGSFCEKADIFFQDDMTDVDRLYEAGPACS